MFGNNDEENEFWSHVPDSRLDRLRRSSRPPVAPRPAARPAGTRSHSDHTGSIPVITAPVDTTALTTKVRQATQHVDPLMRRMGVLAIVVALLIPIALTLRSGDDDAALQPDTTALDTTQPAAAPAAAPADTGAVNPFASIDVDALPPAVPVNPDPAAAPAPQADAATTVSQPAATQAAAPPVTVAAARTEAVPAKPVCATKYTVAAGDAWILIANRAGVTTKALLAVNGATTSTPLYPGRAICLPAGATTPTAPKATTTTVKKAVTPTTVKAPTTTVQKAAPAKSYTKAQVEAIIREIWPDELENEAVRIATRESNLVPTAQNFCCTGLFQIYFNVHKSWLAKIGVTSAAQLKDPRVNAFAALVLYNRSGSWAPWRL